MYWQWTPWVIPHLILIAALVYSAVITRTRLSLFSGNTITLMLVGGTAWLAAETLEYCSLSFTAKTWWDNVQHALVALLPVGFFVVSSKPSRSDRLLAAGLGAAGLCFAGAFLWDASLGWMTAGAWLISAGGNQWLQTVRSPGFFAFIAWAVGVCLWAGLRLVLGLRRGPTGAPYQAIYLIAVALLTLTAGGLDLSRQSPWPYYSFAALVYGSLSLGASWNLVRLRERDEQIALRWTALEEIVDPYLVLDRQGQVVDANQAAFQMSGNSREGVIRRPLKEAWPELEQRISQAVSAQPALSGRQTWEVLISLQQGAVSRRYRVRRSELQDTPGLPFRALLTLRTSDAMDELEPQLGRIVRELGSSHSVTEAMLSLERLPVVMDRVALALVSNLDLAAVWVACIHEGGASLSWLAFRHQVGSSLAADLLDLIGGDARQQSMPEKPCLLSGIDAPVYARLLHGEIVIDQPPQAYFQPFSPAAYCHKVLQRSGLNAAYAVPAEAGGRVIGFILAASRAGVLTPFQQESLRRTAAQAAVVLENHRLQEQQQERTEEIERSRTLLAALGQVAALLPISANPDEIMHAVGTGLRRLNLTCCFADFLAEETALRMRYLSIHPQTLATAERLAGLSRLTYRLPPDVGPLDQVLKHRQPVFLHDMIALSGVFLSQLAPGTARQVYKLVGVPPGTPGGYLPLALEAGRVGLFAVWGSDLRQEDMLALEIFANQMAAALQNGQMLEREQTRAAELGRSNQRIAALGQIAARLRSVLQPDEVLKLLGRELHSLGMECYVSERHPDGNGLYVRYISLGPGVLRKMEKLARMTVQRVHLADDLYPAREVLSGETLFIENLLELLGGYMTFLPHKLVLQVVKLAGVKESSRAVWMPLRTSAGVHSILAIWGVDLIQEDIPALSIFSSQVGVALEYARLHSETTLQLRRQTLLRQASDAWHGVLNMEDVLHQVAEQLGRALDVTSVYICSYDASSGATHVLADFISEYANPVEQISDVGESYFFYLQIEERLNQGVIQYDWDDKRLSDGESIHLEANGCQSVVIVPLEVRDEVAYFAELWESRFRRRFSEEEIELCQDLANTAAMVVDNARLYTELQQRLQERSAVMSAADAVLSSQDLSEVTTRLSETLGRAIDATSAYFIFYNTDDRSYAVIAEYIGPAANEQEHESDLGISYYDDTSELMFMLLQGVPVVQHAGAWNLNLEYQEHLERYSVQSVMFLPLIQAHTGLIGYIEVWETRARREFSPAELRLCQAIAQQASIAIEKSRLYVTAQHEIQERQQVELRLRQSEQEYRSLFENAHDAILLFDLEKGHIQAVNPHACEMYGYSRQELLEMDLVTLSLDSAAEMRQWGAAQSEHGSFHLRTIHRRKDSSEMHLEVTGAPMIYGGRQVMQCILRDITERVRTEERLRFNAFHDGLTSLPNRALFLERLERARARYHREPKHGFAVLFLDLDHFKKVNDTRGHSWGDELLVQAARRLEACVRAVDTVARLGGDEFVILMEDIRDILDASALCERILIHFRKPFMLESEAAYTSVSIGVVMSDAAYSSTEAYLRDADIAMYRAKSAGRNRFEVFDAEMRDQVIKRMGLENDLRQAIELEQFQIFYMPIVDLQDSRVVGLEALLRWHHPQRGLVPPIHFIPIAEETGLILPLGEWVLRRACQQMRTWQERFATGERLAVNVNISGVQLAQSDLVKVVRAALEESLLPPRCLCLEVTESALISDVERALGIISALKEMGVSVQLDDFGTGYSALSYLSQFPIDAIKIDRSFMGVHNGSQRGPDLIRTMVLMGHELGIQVVAEGVETAQQLEYLRSVRCAYGQGYYFARPLPARAAEAYLLENLGGTESGQEM
jgi:diguanylate cyclase (GGDEF)-like protein/PAS domain S-box-containing protein